MYRFIENQRNLGRTNNTINKRLGALKQALKYAIDQELLNHNPLASFKNLSRDDTETEIVDKKVIRQTLRYFQEAEPTEELLRVKCMVMIILDTGIRKNELRNLKVVDVDLNSLSIRLKYTKTNRNRTIFITKLTAEAIVEHLHASEPNEYLFEHEGEIFTESFFQQQLVKLKRKLSLPKTVKFSFHKLRHSYATFCLENGASLEFVRKTLGHHNLTITQKYLHLSNKVLKDEHDHVSPLNNLV